MMKKKLFILGVGGLTGSKLAMMSKSDFEVYGSYNMRNPHFAFIKTFQLNILDVDKVTDILSDTRPDVLVNATSLTNVDYCETYQDEAKKINVEVVEKLCDIANRFGMKFVHMSSDSVFDGKKDSPYVEDDVPNPINMYGYTKFLSEKSVLKDPHNLVVRASVLYGWLEKNLSNSSSSSMKPTNFAQWLIKKLQSNESVKIIQDEYSSPIIADDFARSILHLIIGDHSGIFHSSPNICINRYDFSIRLAEILGLDKNLILPTTNKELGRNVTTGINKCLDSSKIVNKTKFHFLTLNDSLTLIKSQIDN